MKKIFRKEVTLGLIVIFAIAVLVIGIDFLKGVNVFKATNYYVAKYDNVAGLAVSAPVTINGYKVGQVRDITFNYDEPGKVRVEISLDKDLRLPVGSRAILATDLLGTATIQIALAKGSGKFYEVGDSIPAMIDPGLMGSVSTTVMPAVESIFPKIDTLLTSLNTVVGDPALVTTVKRLDEISANLSMATADLAALTRQLKPVTNDVKSITSNVNTITTDLTAFSGKMKEMPIDSITNRLNSTVENLRLLTEQLNDPNSSLGKLTNDPQLYNNLNSTVANLDSLLIDLKRNPKRYISIKLL